MQAKHIASIPYVVNSTLNVKHCEKLSVCAHFFESEKEIGRLQWNGRFTERETLALARSAWQDCPPAPKYWDKDFRIR